MATPSLPPVPDATVAFARLSGLAAQTKAPALAEREARLIVAEWRRARPEGGPALRQAVGQLMQRLDEDAAGPAGSGATVLALEAARRALGEEWVLLSEPQLPPGAAAAESAGPPAGHVVPWFVALGLVCVALEFGFLLDRLLGCRLVGAPLLVAVLACTRLYGRPVAVFATLLGAAAWDFLFLPPLHSFQIEAGADLAAYGTFIAGSVACWFFVRS